MSEYNSLNHTKWECKYHIVFIPKCRRKVLYGKIRRDIGKFFHELAKHGESQILEGHLCPDHVAYGDSHSAKVRGFPGSRVYQGQKCDSDCPRFYGAVSGFQGGITFGPEDILYRPWESMKARFAITFATRKRTTKKLTNSGCFSITMNLTN